MIEIALDHVASFKSENCVQEELIERAQSSYLKTDELVCHCKKHKWNVVEGCLLLRIYGNSIYIMYYVECKSSLK